MTTWLDNYDPRSLHQQWMTASDAERDQLAPICAEEHQRYDAALDLARATTGRVIAEAICTRCELDRGKRNRVARVHDTAAGALWVAGYSARIDATQRVDVDAEVLVEWPEPLARPGLHTECRLHGPLGPTTEEVLDRVRIFRSGRVRKQTIPL